MSPDKDILENCLFNSENLLQQERWGKRDGIKEERAEKKKQKKTLNQMDENLWNTILTNINKYNSAYLHTMHV